MTATRTCAPPRRGAALRQLREWLDRLPDTRWPRAVLAALCLVLFLPGLLSIQPADIGETGVAVATRQMLDGGDLLRIHLGRAESYVRPIGIHWLQAGMVRGLEALHLAHRSGIAAYRLASLLGALLAVLATYHWGRALVGRRAAFLGAAMLAASAAMVAAAHLATSDAPLLAAATAAGGLLGAAYLRPEAFTARQAAGFWLATAAGVLLGGSAALLIPLLTIGALALADRGAPWLRALRPGWGVPLLLGLALPWFVVIGSATGGEAASELFRHDPLGRLAGAPQLPGRHLLLFAATGFPGAWIVLLALPGLWQGRTRPATRLLLAWAGSAWLLFELAGPLPGAILPAFPPLMLLGARWAADPARPPPRPWWLVTAGLLLAGVAGAIGVGALKVAELDIREAPYGLLALAAAALLTWRALTHGRAGAWARAALAGTLLATLLYAAVLGGTFAHLPIGRIADRIAGAAQREAPGLPPDRFGVLGFDGASLLFASGAATHRFADGTEAARFLAGGPGRVLAVADLHEGPFRRAATALGLEVSEQRTIPCYDPVRGEFTIVILYRAAALPPG